MTTTLTPTGQPATTAGTVTRYWKTGVIIRQASTAGALAPGIDPAQLLGTSRCGVLDPALVPGLESLRQQFLESMNALAAADDTAAVTSCDVEVLVWGNGYDQPAFSCSGRYAGWSVLDGSPSPEHAESGCLAFSDPRAGSAGTAMPGLPWGRQFVVITRPGTHAVVPGWLTCSVVPLEAGQHLIVAVAVSGT